MTTTKAPTLRDAVESALDYCGEAGMAGIWDGPIRAALAAEDARERAIAGLVRELSGFDSMDEADAKHCQITIGWVRSAKAALAAARDAGLATPSPSHARASA